MAVYLLDTDHLSYLQERHRGVLARLALLRPEDRLLTSVIAVGELLRGVHLLPKGRRQRELLNLYHDCMRGMEEVLPVTRVVAERFAEVDAALRRKGRPIPINDVWVAAVTLVAGAVLLTGDAHFSSVDHLVTENWAV